MTSFTESVLEEAVLETLASLGWQVVFGPEIAPGEPAAERGEYREVLLAGRLHTALEHLNPSLPPEAIEDAFRKVVNLPHLHPGLGTNNRAFHKMLTDGVDVEYRTAGGDVRGDKAWLVDFAHPENNDFLAVNQFTVEGVRATGQSPQHRRPDVVLFINGLPLVVVELKNPADEKADTFKAFRQIQTYKQEIPSLFAYNEIVVLLDGVDSRAGTFLSPWERFMPWRTVKGQNLAPASMPTVEVLVRGMFEKRRLLDLLHYFIAFAEEDGELKKKLAAYHQFHAVNAALEETLKATAPRRRLTLQPHDSVH
jgi:type I restriction enzyme R subunit